LHESLPTKSAATAGTIGAAGLPFEDSRALSGPRPICHANAPSIAAASSAAIAKARVRPPRVDAAEVPAAAATAGLACVRSDLRLLATGVFVMQDL
jgi:hypothetical protein